MNLTAAEATLARNSSTTAAATTAAATTTTTTTTDTIDYAAYGFRRSFGTWTRTTDLHVCIVINNQRHMTEKYGVYVFHGHPGGAFWRNDAPLVRCDTMEEAREKATTLYGITGSGQFAEVIHAN